MDSGQNPTSPMPGIGPNSGVPPVSPTPTASPFNNLNSRRNRSSRPNSANSMVAPAQPPAGGMVMSAPAPRQKSPVNKGLIIGVIAAIIAIIGGIVALAMLPKGGSNNSTQANIKQAFMEYANFMILGEHQDTNWDEFVNTVPADSDFDTWAIAKVDSLDPQEQHAYINQLNAYQTDLTNAIASDTAKDKSSMAETMKSANELVSIYENYVFSNEITEDIISTYISNGREAASRKISINPDNYTNNSAKILASQVKDTLEQSLNLARVAIQQKCTKDNTIDQDTNRCISDTTLIAAKNEYDKKAAFAYQSGRSVVLNAIKITLSNLYGAIDD